MASGAGRVRAGLATAALAAGATAALVAGCTGSPSPGSSAAGDRETAGPTPTSQPTAPASTSATPPSLPPAPKPVPGRTGQAAFARHVMDLWGYALRTNDVRPLSALAPRQAPCGGCGLFARELARRRAQGWSVDFPGLEVKRVALARRGGTVVARATVDVPASDSYDADGAFRNTNPAHPGARFVVRMRYTGDVYRLLSFTVS